MTRVLPPAGHAMLYDDQPEYDDGGVVVRKAVGCDHLDFTVVAVSGPAQFAAGDRAVVRDANCGRRVMIDGVVYRLVRVDDVLAVAEG